VSKLVVAFDVDDTLIVPAVATGFDVDVPNYEMIAVFRWFQTQGHTMIIWSGGGEDYAAMWANKLGLIADAYHDKHYYAAHIEPKGFTKPDLSFDDSDLDLARVNVKVRRVNNKVVRWPERVAKKAAMDQVVGIGRGRWCNASDVTGRIADAPISRLPGARLR
jgi:hypothetical protein